MKKIGFISVPENTKAILWDMDGTLIDTLSFDLKVCNNLLQTYLGRRAVVTRKYIMSILAYSVPKFWQRIFEKISAELGINSDESLRNKIVEEFTELRQKNPFVILPGVETALADARKIGLKNVVVSNNPAEQVKKVLANAGIANNFDLVVGTDSGIGMREKPAPDMYAYALKQLGIAPEEAVVVEDSLLGGESGKGAGCFTIGVATGTTPREDLLKAPQFFDLVI